MTGFCFLYILPSCKKTVEPPPPPVSNHIGFWMGKYSTGATTYPSYGYAMLLRTNGTVRVFNGADTTTATKAEGTYTFTGTTINTVYSYSPSPGRLSTTAVIDAKNTFQQGSWGNGTSVVDRGKFFLVKQ